VLSEKQADIQEVKEAVSMAVDVINSMATSICSLLSKVYIALSRQTHILTPRIFL
jgi:QWRF family